MSDETTTEVITASVAQAEDLLTKLNLTDMERKWAKAQSMLVFKAVTDAILEGSADLHGLRPIAVPAAIAYALSIAKDWAAAVPSKT